MSRNSGTAPAHRRASLFAGSTTFVVAVGSDIVAGGHPLHTVTLGAVVVAIAVLRLRLADGHSGLFAAISAALLVQPVLHAATKLIPSGAGTIPGAAGHAAAEASVTALHVVVAALVLSAVAGVEQLYVLVAESTPVVRWLLDLLLWYPRRPQPLGSVPPPPPAPAHRWVFAVHIPRRGPPGPVRAAA